MQLPNWRGWDAQQSGQGFLDDDAGDVVEEEDAAAAWGSRARGQRQAVAVQGKGGDSKVAFGRKVTAACVHT